MKLLGVVLLSALVSACSLGNVLQKQDLDSGVQQTGKVFFCSGSKNWPDCERAALAACPNGYDVLSKEEQILSQGRSLRVNCK